MGPLWWQKRRVNAKRALQKRPIFTQKALWNGPMVLQDMANGVQVLSLMSKEMSKETCKCKKSSRKKTHLYTKKETSGTRGRGLWCGGALIVDGQQKHKNVHSKRVLTQTREFKKSPKMRHERSKRALKEIYEFKRSRAKQTCSVRGRGWWCRGALSHTKKDKCAFKTIPEPDMRIENEPYERDLWCPRSWPMVSRGTFIFSCQMRPLL